jgi:hypothetical protein
MDHCPNCNHALATDHDLNEHPRGCSHCADLCWQHYNGDCNWPQVNWRELAMSYQAAAVHWAEAYARELDRP